MVRRKIEGVVSFSCLVFAALLISMCALTASADEITGELPHDARVVVLHSYHYGFSWSDSISAGIRAVFSEKSRDIELKFEFLDTRFNASEPYLDSLKRTLETKYADRKVSVVIASDDHALNFMLSYGQTVFPGVPVVFCSVSGFKPEMRQHLKLTGVRESIDIRSTVETALRLHPETEEITVILDRSRTGQALREKAEAALKPFAGRIGVRYLEDLTVEQLKQKLPELPRNTLVLLFIFPPDETGRVLSHEQNLERLRGHCPFPIYAVWQFYLGHGIVGGRLTDGYEEGRMAAHMATHILKGEDTDDIPLDESPTKYMFDHAELTRFNVDPAALPATSVVINRPFSYYQANKVLIWDTVVAFMLLVLVLLGVTFGLVRTRRVEQKLRRNEENLRTTLNSIGDAVIATDNEGIITRMNPQAEKLTGWTVDLARGRRLGKVFRIVNAQTQQPAVDPVRRVIESGEIVGLANHTMLIGKDGIGHQIADSAAPIRDRDGNTFGAVLVFRDVTDDYQMRVALIESKERFRDLVELLPEAVFETDVNLELRFANQRAFEMFGYTKEDLNRGMNSMALIVPEDRGRARETFARRIKGETPGSLEYRALRKDGTTFPMIYHASAIVKDGEFVGLRGLIVDITERKRAEVALQESEEKYRRIFENSVVGFYQRIPRNRFINVNPAFAKMFGYASPEDVVAGLTDIEAQYYVDPEDRTRFQKILRKDGKVDGFEFRAKRRDRAQMWVSTSTRAYFDRNGEIVHYEGVVSDITENKRAWELTQIRMRLLEFAPSHTLEEFLSKTLDEAERLVDSAVGFYHFVEADQKTLSLQAWSTATRERFCKAQGRGLHYDIDQAGVWVDCVRARRPVIHNDYAHLAHRKGMPKGHAAVIRELVVPIFREGRIVAILGVGNKPHDYTEQDAAIVTYLADIAWEIIQAKRLEEEQKHLQSQLVQAQKFEAIGTLAGGIAHDFNNLLMGIQGRASLIAVELGALPSQKEHIDAIEAYVRSATDLTKQLLGFARGGKYEVRPIDLNELVLDSAAMFGRTRKEIRRHTRMYPSLLVVEGDKRQIEQVLLNLYVNAWQAMPDGGELFLETTLVNLDDAASKPHQSEPGYYAKISVTDTGVGMESAIQQRIFDPFFTSKEKGRGTGLGLASAYGIIKNHHGMITVYSEVGNGTTFSIYLPATDGEVRREASPVLKMMQGSEIVLIVDDEEMIVEVGRAMLEKLGYQVLTANGGKQAVATISDKNGGIDLVILDLIMPEMDGGRTFDRIREIQPALPVILSSGYAINGQASEILGRGCNGFIQKPFNLSELSQKIRTVLDAVKNPS